MATKVQRKEIAERIAGNIVRMLHNGSTPMESLYKFKGDREVLDTVPEITIGRLDLETMRVVAQIIDNDPQEVHVTVYDKGNDAKNSRAEATVTVQVRTPLLEV